jgi:hypothetical protein
MIVIVEETTKAHDLNKRMKASTDTTKQLTIQHLRR